MLPDRILQVVILVVGLILPTLAVAGDYSVSYAFDGAAKDEVGAAVGPLNESGATKDCTYRTTCTIDLAKSGISIRLHVDRSERDGVRLAAYADRRAGIRCCFFNDGEDRVLRNLRDPFVRLNIYEGHRRKGNEFIQNLHLGVLYLQFSDLR